MNDIGPDRPIDMPGKFGLTCDYLPDDQSPSVDSSLLERLARRELSPEERNLVFRLVNTFRPWRQAFTEIVEARLAAKANEEMESSTDPQKSPISTDATGEGAQGASTPPVLTVPSQSSKIDTRHEQGRKRQPLFSSWVGWTSVAIAAGIIGFLLGHLIIPPATAPRTQEVLLANLRAEPGQLRDGKPAELILDAHGVYQISEEVKDFHIVIRSPKKGNATIIMLQDRESKVYPLPTQQLIHVESLKPRSYGPFLRPGTTTTVVVVVTEASATDIIRSLMPNEAHAKHDVGFYLGALKEALWTNGYRWVALDQFVLEPTPRKRQE